MKLKENITGKQAIYDTEFEMKIEGDNLIAIFNAKHSTFNSYSDKYNDNLYEADVVEIFLDMGVKNHYYEIEVAPNGAIFLADITNDGKTFSGVRLTENFVKAIVEKYGDNYSVKIEIPLEKLGYKEELGIKYNAYRIETEGIEPNKHLFALSPTLCGSFHKKESFIKL